MNRQYQDLFKTYVLPQAFVQSVKPEPETGWHITPFTAHGRLNGKWRTLELDQSALTGITPVECVDLMVLVMHMVCGNQVQYIYEKKLLKYFQPSEALV